MRVLNTLPSAATPVAIPSWRKVELIPEAIPERRALTTPTAVEASGTLMRPAPAPARMKPGRECVQPWLRSMPRMSRIPAPVSTNPGAMSQRTGSTLESRRAACSTTSGTGPGC